MHITKYIHLYDSNILYTSTFGHPLSVFGTSGGNVTLTIDKNHTHCASTVGRISDRQPLLRTQTVSQDCCACSSLANHWEHNHVCILFCIYFIVLLLSIIFILHQKNIKD